MNGRRFYYFGSTEGHEYPDLQVGDEVNLRVFFSALQILLFKLKIVMEIFDLERVGRQPARSHSGREAAVNRIKERWISSNLSL